MLENLLNEDMKKALKQKDPLTVSVIRMLKSEINSVALKQGYDRLDDPDIIKVIQQQIKQHQDSINQFKQGNRPDLVDKEMMELEILKKYMPQELSDKDLVDIVNEVIKETGANSMKDMGKVMKMTLEKAAGRAFGQRVSETVKQMLS
ncbi:MAG: GatB/YqeY domain-containing protein [Candidatus Omnitrophica bacterium]|nr:GatB/YqeY domain-containing protein [Candidatus Omnitrophota bacterium]